VFFLGLWVVILRVLNFSRDIPRCNTNSSNQTLAAPSFYPDDDDAHRSEDPTASSCFIINLLTYPLKMGDSRIQQTWKKEGNRNKSTHVEFHPFCQQSAKHAPRRASRSLASRKPATQRNMRRESGTGAIAGPTVRQARRSFGRSSRRLQNSVVEWSWGGWWNNNRRLSKGYIVRGKIRVVVFCLNHNFVAF
jgi:hypothetical protein